MYERAPIFLKPEMEYLNLGYNNEKLVLYFIDRIKTSDL